ncbi:putative leucine-rich repeat domain superfamily [Helianthus annuus]|uniref:Leucine-rich repeat domain superfamily n=1 Tax=Helianthus annuus TaxID=4232 RepID=A0A251VJS3_HELAN|nr:putative leucine-rich repeat domain superfamily [Helianthus annuus]KAJ0606134.1 putative leucine-rich repeat domain superfamily [Helianthus annuus]KAJ0617089.1 putative leucine-rich repeat domain superfamily [Helianthus annuus]KAJ0620151.1 putative leucine-rich repeat domain superfamily [Helianthus annuus]KAJ0778600.1 putative leucine-rich repeat domain superfamily [Helianthus annuus]
MILNLQKLSVLSLDDCDLSQIIHPYSHSAANFSFPPHISQIYLGNNNLNSSMYHWLFPLTSNRLETLDLSGNKLDGIPEYLGNLCLGVLYFDENSMPVVFPDLLKNLSGCTSVTLELLQAQSSQLTGSISDDIQKFSSLEALILSHNKLNGSISEKLWKLPNLFRLDLSSNYLKGAIPKIKGKSKITFINLSNNSLEVVPSIAWKCSVRRIDMSSNNFHGPIPHVPSLCLLDLSDNSLTGEIPDCFWHFKQLRVLKLGQNNFSGRLPASLKYLTKLEVLYLYNNSFTGEFPLSLQACKKLAFLDLGANKFSGYVPIWIGEKLQSLYIFRLSSNNFYGTIPSQLCPLVNLTVLDLSMNNLYGTIPTCLGNLTSMVQSSDQNVHAYSTYWEYFGDSYVDHMTFNWQGSIREFSSTLGLMKSIDLSSNNLTGIIPDELTDLHELITLNLSMNALLGGIPANIGQMTNLLHLDVSRNNLSGNIPLSMSQMSSLNYLDVSYNNLSGRIPSGTQLQSFERSRYIGNEGLCGPPLTKYCPGDKELEVTPFLGQSEIGGKGIDELETWFYIGGAIGFATGFWIVCGTLIVNRRWRNAFFHYFDSLKDWVYVKMMVFIAKLQRGANA